MKNDNNSLHLTCFSFPESLEENTYLTNKDKNLIAQYQTIFHTSLTH